MTAQQLIWDIFSRSQNIQAPDMRNLSAEQFAYLRDLIELEASAAPATLRKGESGSLVWMPPGADKYILTEYAPTGRHSLTRLPNYGLQGAGMLFPNP